MAKYYVYNNATRRLRSGDYTYSFDVIEQFGGAWRGVLKLEDAGAIAALESFGPQIGVNEISEIEYDELLKKKLSSPRSSPDIIRLPVQVQPGLAGAAVVKSPLNLTTPNSTPETRAKPELEEAVVIGVAPYVDPLDQRSGSKRKSKK